MNHEYLDYKSAKRIAAKSIAVLIGMQILAAAVLAVYFYCMSDRLPEKIYIHHHLSYQDSFKVYGNAASKIDANIIIFTKTELVNKFIYRCLLAYSGSGIAWYLIFKIIGTRADWARPKLDKSIVQFYRLCWYCRIMYMFFPFSSIDMLRLFEVIRIGLGASTADEVILSWYSTSMVVLFPISIIVHALIWKKLNIPVYW
jgi:hypothetical protein